MNRLEYLLSAFALRVCYFLFRLAPVDQNKIVFASARADVLEGNLKHLHSAIRRERPDLRPVLLLERYSYDFVGKLRYMFRLVRGAYHLATARFFIVDNAYLPLHVAKHRKGTTVIQVWHAAGALKRFGVDISAQERTTENRFVHRNYDYVVVGSTAAIAPYASALRTDPAHVITLGTPRTDYFFDEDALAETRARFFAKYPELKGKKLVLYAPTFRGHGRKKKPYAGLDFAALRKALPDDYVLINKNHPVLDVHSEKPGDYDIAADSFDINELFPIIDVLVTDYSSSIFEYAPFRKPLVLLVDDLESYSRNPGLYIDYKTAMIGAQAVDTDGVAQAIIEGPFDPTSYDAFIEEHCHLMDGHASERFVDWFNRL
ncbi:MAG: CDP-glycerol glycerophosphotransferase family protein [Coriobacteriia bacterium]|nr:CDP-glycerol glycerophosphotransferase family protein [Coriobacteriia bacterium]MBN2822839.1 CDP-glycerol glycerophosphotransferase family protein [Coriobacteriia bacterium]